jgi:hypothetical protein
MIVRITRRVRLVPEVGVEPFSGGRTDTSGVAAGAGDAVGTAVKFGRTVVNFATLPAAPLGTTALVRRVTPSDGLAGFAPPFTGFSSAIRLALPKRGAPIQNASPTAAITFCFFAATS